MFVFFCLFFFDQDFTFTEIKKLVIKLNTEKSTGPDRRIPYEILVQQGIQTLFLSIINVCFQKVHYHT